eukprot:g22922.t1
MVDTTAPPRDKICATTEATCKSDCVGYCQAWEEASGKGTSTADGGSITISFGSALEIIRRSFFVKQSACTCTKGPSPSAPSAAKQE